jgi:AcrR family transcriptional regulator
MVRLTSDRGFAHTTVSSLVLEAEVSRTTFYSCFDGLEDCFLASMDAAYLRVTATIAAAFEDQSNWRDGIRDALAALLVLFEQDPPLARFCFVETLAAGAWALERRDEHLCRLTAMILQRWPVLNDECPNPIAVAGVMESILGLIHKYHLADTEDSLLSLLGPLMGIVSAVHAGGQSAAEEIVRGESQRQKIIAGRTSSISMTQEAAPIPHLLLNPRSRRARECFSYIAAHPNSNNREVMRGVGINAPEQVSRILSRLHALGLLAKRAARPGGANAWSLSAKGAEVRRALGDAIASESP